MAIGRGVFANSSISPRELIAFLHEQERRSHYRTLQGFPARRNRQATLKEMMTLLQAANKKYDELCRKYEDSKICYNRLYQDYIKLIALQHLS